MDEKNGCLPSIENNKNEPDKKFSGKRTKKEKGQNKKRPRTVPLEKINDRLCPNLSRGTAKCDTPDECKFSHDVVEYLRKKPADVGDICPHFRQKGKCDFGLECRFAKCHITEDLKNMVDEEKFEKFSKERPTVTNILNKEMQIRLRKKQFPFPKTSEYLKELNKPVKPDVSDQAGDDAQMPEVVSNAENACNDDTIIRPNAREIKTVSF